MMNFSKKLNDICKDTLFESNNRLVESKMNPNEFGLKYDQSIDLYLLNDIILDLESRSNFAELPTIMFDSSDNTIFFADNADEDAFDRLSMALNQAGVPNKKIKNINYNLINNESINQLNKKYRQAPFSHTPEEIIERKKFLKNAINIYEANKKNGSISKRDETLLKRCYSELREGLNVQIKETFDLPDLDEMITLEYSNNIIDNVNLVNEFYWVVRVEIDQELDHDFDGYTIILKKEKMNVSDIIALRDKFGQYYLDKYLTTGVFVFDTENAANDFMLRVKVTLDKAKDSVSGIEYQIVIEGKTTRKPSYVRTGGQSVKQSGAGPHAAGNKKGKLAKQDPLTGKHKKSLTNIIDEDKNTMINEAYEDRVMMIVKEIIKQYPETIESATLRNLIKKLGNKFNVPEFKLGEYRINEFISDVKKKLLAHGVKIKKSLPNPLDMSPSRQEQNKLIRDLAYAIVQYAGESFPDGDPIDMLILWMERKGLQPDVKWLDMAARRHLGAKSYNDYLASLYDDFVGDNPGMYDLDPKQNPWRTNEENEVVRTNQLRESIDRIKFLAGIKK